MICKYVPAVVYVLLFCLVNDVQNAESNQNFSSNSTTAEEKIEQFTASATATQESAILELYNKLFQLSYSTSPEIKIARETYSQKKEQVYTATARRFAPAIDAEVSQVHELNYEEPEVLADNNGDGYVDDEDYADWGLGLDLPLFRKSLSVSLQIAKAEEKLAENTLQIRTHELDLKLKELLGNYLQSTYRLFNIQNSIKLSSEHVAKIKRGYELRDQTKLQLLRAQANLKDLETRLDIDEQNKDITFRELVDFSGLEEGAVIFSEINNLLYDEEITSGSIATLAAIEDNYKKIEKYIEKANSQELFTEYRQNSLFYQNIVLEKMLADERAERFTQKEWFDISVRGNYDRREDTRFSDYDGEGKLSLVLSVPLFTGGTIFSTQKTKASALSIANTKEVADLRTQFYSIENTKKSISSLLNVLEKQQINLLQQEEIVVLSLKSYQIKQTSMQDLLTSQNKLIDIKNALMQTTNRLGSLFRQFALELGTPFPSPQVPL